MERAREVETCDMHSLPETMRSPKTLCVRVSSRLVHPTFRRTSYQDGLHLWQS